MATTTRTQYVLEHEGETMSTTDRLELALAWLADEDSPASEGATVLVIDPLGGAVRESNALALALGAGRPQRTAVQPKRATVPAGRSILTGWRATSSVGTA